MEKGEKREGREVEGKEGRKEKEEEKKKKRKRNKRKKREKREKEKKRKMEMKQSKKERKNRIKKGNKQKEYFSLSLPNPFVGQRNLFSSKDPTNHILLLKVCFIRWDANTLCRKTPHSPGEEGRVLRVGAVLQVVLRTARHCPATVGMNGAGTPSGCEFSKVRAPANAEGRPCSPYDRR